MYVRSVLGNPSHYMVDAANAVTAVPHEMPLMPKGSISTQTGKSAPKVAGIETLYSMGNIMQRNWEIMCADFSAIKPH